MKVKAKDDEDGDSLIGSRSKMFDRLRKEVCRKYPLMKDDLVKEIDRMELEGSNVDMIDELCGVIGLDKSNLSSDVSEWSDSDVLYCLRPISTTIKIPDFTSVDDMEARLLDHLSILESNLPNGKNDNRIVPTLVELLGLYESWNDEKAEESFRKGEEIVSRLESFGSGLYEIGSFYHTYGQYDKALYFWSKDLEEERKEGDEANIGACLNNMAIVWTAR